MKKILLIFLVIAFSCDNNNESLEPELVQQLEIEIKDNVVVLTDNNQTINDIEEILSGNLVVQPVSAADDIDVGTVLIGQEDGGFLVKVITKTIEGDQVTFQVEQANMEDVFENAEFSFNADLSETLQRNKNNNNQNINSKRDGEGFSFDFSNTVIYQDGPVVFNITDGSAEFNPNFQFDFDFENSTLQQFEFSAENANLTIDCDLFFGLNAEDQFSTSTTIAEYDKTFTTFVGFVPVVVTVSTELVAELSIETEGQFGFTGGFTSVNTTTLGATYNDGVWNYIGETSSNTMGKPVDNPAVAQIMQNITITPKVDIKFYNVIGPYCKPIMTEDLTMGVSFDSNNPDWNAKVDAGLNIVVGADAQVLGETLVDYNTSIFSSNVTVWEAPKTLEIVSGNQQEGTQGAELDEPLKVKVTDNMGDPISSVPVYFQVTPGDGEVDNTNVLTDDEGFAEVIWTLGTFTTEQSVNVEIRNSGGDVIGETLAFTSNAGEVELSLIGDLSFGEVELGSSENISFTIENANSTPIDVSSIDIPEGYSVNWNSGQIAAESTQEVVVTFSPTELQDYNGDIIVNNDVDDINNLISVTGTGVVQNAISLSGDMNFGDVEISSQEVRFLTVQNNTIVPMLVTSVDLPVGYTANWTGGLINGQSSQNIDITFSPSNIQDYNGSIIVNNDLDSENNVIQVTGSGIEEVTGPDITGFWISNINMSECNAAGNSNDQGCVNHTTFEGLELEFSEDLNYNYCEDTSISCGIVYNDGVYLNSEVFLERSFNFDGVNLRMEIRTYSTSGYFFDDRTFIFEGVYEESTDSFSGNYSHETDGGLWNNLSIGTMTLTRS